MLQINDRLLIIEYLVPQISNRFLSIEHSMLQINNRFSNSRTSYISNKWPAPDWILFLHQYFFMIDRLSYNSTLEKFITQLAKIISSFLQPAVAGPASFSRGWPWHGQPLTSACSMKKRDSSLHSFTAARKHCLWKPNPAIACHLHDMQHIKPANSLLHSTCDACDGYVMHEKRHTSWIASTNLLVMMILWFYLATLIIVIESSSRKNCLAFRTSFEYLNHSQFSP